MRTGDRALRLGLLLDGPEVPGWLAPALLEGSNRGHTDIVLVVERASPDIGGPSNRVRRWWRSRGTLLYHFVALIDRSRKGLPPLPAPVPIRQLAPSARHLVVEPITTRYTDALTEGDLALIRDADLDILIRAGFRILRGGILSAARLGVWGFHHGDSRSNRGGPPGVWEVLDDLPTSGVILQQLTEELDGGRILARSVGTTKRFSFHRNLLHLLARSPVMLSRSLKRAWAGESPIQPSVRHEPSWSGYCERILRTPTNTEMARRLPRLLGRYLRERWRGGVRGSQWLLAWRWIEGTTSGVPSADFHRYSLLAPAPGHLWADPFVAEQAGRHWIFFEELSRATGKGIIRALEVGSSGPQGTAFTVLEEPWHLSFPFTFSHAGQWFMLPEAGASGSLQLYRALDFPSQWKPYATLLEGVAVFDPCLHHVNGTWYLFCSLGEAGIAPDEELHLFLADRLEGPYVPHPASPLVTDVTCARMAGRLFNAGDALLRPAQCCAPHYGAGIFLRRISVLSPTEYEEVPAQLLWPRWRDDLSGMHTLNAAGRLSAIDLLSRAGR